MNQPDQTLSGQVVWITGGSSGIGQHCAMAMARAGARVIISGRRSEQIDAAIKHAKALSQSTHPTLGFELDLVGLALDVSDKTAVFNAVQDISARFGDVDILVNSAGINVPNRAWGAVDADAFERVIAINLNGTMYCTLAVLPGMRTKQNGLVIHIASWAGRYVSGLTGPSYTAAKHAVVAMSQSLNMEECVNNIRSTAILPGEVATPIMQSRAVPPSAAELARMLKPEQVAQTVLFVTQMPPSVCVNEILISPTWTRSYPSVQARNNLKA